MQSADEKLELARRHLERVQSAWDEPTDWDDLSLYGFYCLENAVEAAAKHFGIGTSRKHWEKADLAGDLHESYGLLMLNHYSEISTKQGKRQPMETLNHQT